MPRPWDNAPWRRRLMQVALCAMLGASVLLAWLVSRQHYRHLVPVEWKDYSVGTLYLRLPAKWHTKTGMIHRRPVCTATEPQPYMGVQRSIEIDQVNVSKVEPAEDYVQSLDPRVTAESTQPFDFLGQKGVLVELPMEWDEARFSVVQARLFATVVLPEGIAVTVELSGPRYFVPADQDLLKMIANSMRKAGAGHEVAQAPGVHKLIDF